MAKFCPSCGHQQENESATFCSKCGASLNNAQQNTQQTFNQQAAAPGMVMGTVPNESYLAAIIAGYVCSSFLTLLLGIIGLIASIAIGIYLYTRDSDDARKHGLVVIALSVIMFIITIFLMGILMSSYYYY